MAKLIFKTDFEDAVKISDVQLNLPIAHYFNFQGEGGARMWVEGLDEITPQITPHSGNRCVGMELSDVTLSRRNQLEILDLEQLVGDEIFVSLWLLLPSDWALYAPDPPYMRWCSLVNPMIEHTNWAPMLELITRQPNITPGPPFDIAMEYRDPDDVQHFPCGWHEDFPLPRGRWFNVKWHLIRHQTNGFLKMWVDNQLICSGTGIATKGTIDKYLMTAAKIYHATTDLTTHRIWLDDLEIWSGMPTPTLPVGLISIPVALAMLGFALWRG